MRVVSRLESSDAGVTFTRVAAFTVVVAMCTGILWVASTMRAPGFTFFVGPIALAGLGVAVFSMLHATRILPYAFVIQTRRGLYLAPMALGSGSHLLKIDADVRLAQRKLEPRTYGFRGATLRREPDVFERRFSTVHGEFRTRVFASAPTLAEVVWWTSALESAGVRLTLDDDMRTAVASRPQIPEL